MSGELKKEIAKIAEKTHRTLSSAIELLLWRGVQEYKADGLLVDARRSPSRRKGKGGARGLGNEEEDFAERIADRIVAKVLEKIESEGKQGDGEHHAAA
jgi:hypothetical protein